MDLPANQTAQAGREAARKTRDKPYSQEAKAQNSQELFDKIIFIPASPNGVEENFEEQNKAVPTGFCRENEIDCMREYQSTISLMGFVEEQLDLKGQLRPAVKLVHRKMNFIPHSSKSRNGFAFRTLKTDRIIQDENINQQFGEEEEPGMMTKLWNKLTGFAGGKENRDPVLPEKDMSWGGRGPDTGIEPRTRKTY